MGTFARNRASKLALAAAFALVAPVLAQTPAAKPWNPPRTPDGQPDLQGYWSNFSPTPLERPAELAGKAFFTDEEIAENEKKAKQPKGVEVLGGTLAHYDFIQYGLDVTQAKHALSRRTSLIVDPPDGKIPPLLPEARKRAADRAEARKRTGPYDSVQVRSLQERCILMGNGGPPMLPQAYNSNIQIHQGPGYVVIEEEEIHDARIVPLDGRPHLGPNIRRYQGDPRGHWEGNTLVVDSTNFTDRTNFRGSSENLHVIERFTLLDKDTLLYQFTLEDPSTWARPWTGELLMARIDGPIYEFACHEGNYGLANTLSAVRAQEKADAEKAAAEAAKKNGK
jgi:hypothetical protein